MTAMAERAADGETGTVAPEPTSPRRDRLELRPIEAADAAFVRARLDAAFAGTLVVRRGRSDDAAGLPGLVAWAGGERVGLCTWRLEADELEVVTLEALQRRGGVGTALLAAARRVAEAAGARRLWLVTTNDNTAALAFYVASGLRLVAVHLGAVDEARRRKPALPLVGEGGVELHDEWELELALVPRPAQAELPRVVATAGVVVTDGDGRLLLVRRADDGSWCLPGGRLEPGETWASCAVRECEEETGLVVEATGLFGTYGDPATQIHRYPDGSLVHFVGVVFTARIVSGGSEVSPDEIVERGYFARGELPGPLLACDAPIVADVFSGAPPPFAR